MSKKITELPAGTALTGAELFESVQSASSVKLTANQIWTLPAAGVLSIGDTQLSQIAGAESNIIKVYNNAANSGFYFYTSSGQMGRLYGDTEAGGDIGMQFVSSGNLYLAADGNFFALSSFGTVNFVAYAGDMNFTSALSINFSPSTGMTFFGNSLFDASGNLTDINGSIMINRTNGQQPAITAPSGGATIDSQARTAIGTIITTLQTIGLTL